MENKKRFFAFGCSLVCYCWPTWADIIAHTFRQQGKEAYNFGLSGTGPMHVLYSVMRAKQEYNITEDDLVIILWSSWTREDRIHNNFWSQWGSILNGQHPELMSIWTLEFDIIKSITAFDAVNELINVDLNLSIHQEVKSTNEQEEADPLLKAFTDFNMINAWDHRDTLIKDNLWSRVAYLYDGHPATPDHLKYVDDFIVPKLPGLYIHPRTRKWVNRVDAEATDNLLETFGSLENITRDDFTEWRGWSITQMENNVWTDYKFPEADWYLWRFRGPDGVTHFTLDMLKDFEKRLDRYR